MSGNHEIDYYYVLGLTKESSKKEIRCAYLRLASIYHPDKFIDEKEKKTAHNRFILIGRAYEILSSDNERYKYDLIYDELKFNKNGNEDNFESYYNFSNSNQKVKFKMPFDEKSNLFKHFEDLFKEHSKIFSSNLSNVKNKETSLIKYNVTTTKSTKYKDGYIIEKTQTICENGATIETIRKYNPNKKMIDKK
jgi:DnaJ-class molecular chaperone